MHELIASFLRRLEDREVRTATFKDEVAFGIPDEVIDNTDVLILYSHMLQKMVSDERVQKVIDRVVNEGMGLVFAAVESSRTGKPVNVKLLMQQYGL